MSVKSSQSGARMLTVLETIAAEQPIGASALARQLHADKSAIQRSIVTLAQAGWIMPTDERPVRWELSARMFSLAHLPHSSENLRNRATPALRQLRDRTGETAFLAIPDLRQFIVVEVAESRQLLRTAPRIGELIPPDKSSTGRAILPFMDLTQQTSLLGREPDEENFRLFDETARRGYAESIDEVMDGSTNIAAPIIGANGRAIAAIAITAPTDRLDSNKRNEFGEMLAHEASHLSLRPAVRPAA